MMQRSRVYLAVSVFLVVIVGATLLFRSLDQGNLVLMKDTERRLTAKNLVAVSGDTVSILNGRIIVNGEPTSFTVEQSLPWEPQKVGDQFYFVAGDPFDVDSDSDQWGIVPTSAVLATIRFE